MSHQQKNRTWLCHPQIAQASIFLPSSPDETRYQVRMVCWTRQSIDLSNHLQSQDGIDYREKEMLQDFFFFLLSLMCEK
jgi:hypothetical protein